MWKKKRIKLEMQISHYKYYCRENSCSFGQSYLIALQPTHTVDFQPTPSSFSRPPALLSTSEGSRKVDDLPVHQVRLPAGLHC